VFNNSCKFFLQFEVKVRLCEANAQIFLCPNKNAVTLSGQSLIRDRCDGRMASRIASSAAMEANCCMSFTASGVVVTCSQFGQEINSGVNYRTKEAGFGKV